MIEVTGTGVFIHCADDCIRGITYKPRPCGCARMTFFFVNRDGRSRCADCDAEYVQRQARHVRG
jgi:hypothetical protein